MRALYRINPKTGELEEIYNSERPTVHFVHTDEIAPTEHPATGEIFTSRKKFDEATIRSGCVPVYGNDKPVKQWISNAERERIEHQKFERAFETAYRDVDARMAPPPRSHAENAALWKRINGYRDDS